MATIALSGMAITGRHGVSDEERHSPQTFIVDVVMDVETSAAQVSDDLSQTVDYAAVQQQVISIVENTSYKLLERLAQAIADEVLRNQQIRHLTVVISKPEVLENGIPSVEISFTR